MYADEYWQGTEVAYDIVYGGVQLPWEWQSQFRLRNVLYPYYLSIPLWIIKLLNIDKYYIVRVSPYLAHSVLVILSDYFFYQIGKKMVGQQATRMALYLYMTNNFYNTHLIRCFTNSVETIIHIIVFNYYLDTSSKFDKKLAIIACLLSISMGIRNTSIVAWVPLLIIKLI